MCKHPKRLIVRNEHPTAAYPEAYIEVEVPCGKCLDCLKRRQSEYATRLYNECKDGQVMFFVTLTYREDCLPLSITFKHIDLHTGEILDQSEPEFLEESEFASVCRKHVLAKKISSKPRVYRDKCMIGSNGIGLYYEVTPSLRRKDVAIWIKKCRIQYKRDYGVNLNFRVAYCGEYGPNGCRPHYHCIFIGASFEQVMYMLNYWHYGYTNWKNVPSINPDGTNARQIVAKYVGKYISKGKFDCESVICKLAQKGRLCNSKRFGTRIFTNELKAYYRCYDLFGPYNIDTLKLRKSGITLNDEQIRVLCAEIVKRNHIDVLVGDKPFILPMPKAFKRYIWLIPNFYYDFVINDGNVSETGCSTGKKNSVLKRRLVSPLILRKVSDYLRDRTNADIERQFEFFCAHRNTTKEDISAFIEFYQSIENPSVSQEEVAQENEFQRRLFLSQRDGQ